MKKIIIILFFITSTTQATHIIGGDISVAWISGNTYEITLQIFRDCSSPLNAGFDDPIYNAAIYEDVTNNFVQSVGLPLTNTFINDLGDECYTPQGLCVETGIYKTQVTIPSPNPNGYYVVWERCCRNASISNILVPTNTGMAFLSYFPDADSNFNAYNNSTPSFGTYPTDGYFCLGKINEIDFNVTEIDGDSLYYSFSEPLAGFSDNINALPNPSPQPYPAVNWFSGGGYDATNPLGQAPASISIDNFTGILNAIPYSQGIFVFGITVEEFRNGIKIGEIRRELQFEVLTCDDNEFPTIASEDSLDLLNHPEYFYNGDTVEFTHFVYPESNFCIDISAFDADINDGVKDSVWLTADVSLFNQMVTDPIGFEADSSEEQIITEFCWFPTCDDLENFNSSLPYSIVFTANDNACRGKNYSFLKLIFEFQEEPLDFNKLPNVFSPNGDNKNDAFSLQANINECFDEFFEINIYNRWGKLVYNSNDILFEWNGTINNVGNTLPEGIYYYSIQLNKINIPKKGFVHLFR